MMTKKNLMPLAVLAIICLIVAALLAAVNVLTAPVIKHRNEEAILASLEEAMPGGEFNTEPDKLPADAPETIYKAYTEKTGKGTVIVLVTNKGYTGKNIGLTLGVNNEGKITGMVITQNDESIVPKELKPGGAYGNAYVDKGADDIADLETGATVVFTEGAIKGAVNDAFVYLGFAKALPELPREESEIESLAKEFYGDSSAKLESIKPEEGEFVKRIYKEKNKDSYVAYAFTYSQYGTPEFEVLVHVDENGTIKNIKKVLWKVSDPKPEWGYNPPSESEVDAFFERFVGKNSSDVTSVEVATGATNTGERLRVAVGETLKFAEMPDVNYAPRTVGIAVIAVAAVAAVIIVIFYKKRRAQK
jgi:Na+-translocating ferredoxin:NAD+ oxidoreductase RnfG subunit